MHCIIHIGTHKTGTTSIQLALSRARASLAAQGILYPSQPGLALDKFVCHHKVASQMNGFGTFYIDDMLLGPDLQQLSEALENTDANYLVLSSEVFSDTSMGRDIEGSPLMQLVQKHCNSINVVCFVRPQVELLQSAYIEVVKDFSYFLEFTTYLREAMSTPFFDYITRLTPWSNSRDFKFTAIPFNKSIDVANLTNTMLLAGGIPATILTVAGIPNTQRINQDPGTKTIAALRRAIPELHELQRNPSRDYIKLWYYQEAKRRGWTRRRFHGYTAKTFDFVNQQFRDSNWEFARAQWREDWNDIFELSTFSARKRTEIALESASSEVLNEIDEFIMQMKDFIDGEWKN